MVHRKELILNKLWNGYQKGLMTSYEYWDQRSKITIPDLIVKRTIIAKKLGLLNRYLGEFSIVACYEDMMKGRSIDRWKLHATIEKKKRDERKKMALRSRRHAQILSSLR